MSPIVLEVAENASGIKLPLHGDTFLIRFSYTNHHFRWAKVHLKLFEKHFYNSSITSLGCCQEADEKSFDKTLDSIHNECCGIGRWLKREYGGPPSSQSNANKCDRRSTLKFLPTPCTACENRESSALQQLGIDTSRKHPRAGGDDGSNRTHLSFEDRHLQLKSQLYNLHDLRPQIQNDAKSNKRRKASRLGYSENISQLRKEAASIEKSLLNLSSSGINDLQRQAVEKTIGQKSSAICTAGFVQTILGGIAHLRERKSADQSQIPTFGKLFAHRTNWQDNNEIQLVDILLEREQLLRELGGEAGSTQAKAKFEYELLADNANLFRQFLLSRMETREEDSSTMKTLSEDLIKTISSGLGSSSSKTNRKWRTHLRSSKQQKFFNGVVRGLHQSAGPSALGVFGVLEGFTPDPNF